MGSSKSKPEQTVNDPNSTPLPQKNPQVITKTKQQPKSSDQQIISDKQINNIVNSVAASPQHKQTIFVQDCATIIDKNITPLLANIQTQYKEISQYYFKPLSKNYKEIPEEMTAIKFTYLNCYGYSDRLTALGLGSMIVGVASFRTAKVYQLPLRTFAALKDATLSYLIGGLAIAPEIYNPLIN